jgi:TonB-linked SusC/RagA family outer membrane protein
MCAILCAFNLFAQTRTVTGKVTDEKGNGLPSVAIGVKGTRANALSGSDGRFSITVPAAGKVLVISSVGYAPKEITIGTQTDIPVSLEVSGKTLDDVVVTGYSNLSRSKTALGGSVISSKEIEDIPMSNVNDIFQGKAPGLTVMSTTGQPGGVSNVRIRGVGSISASATPLYVIDGVAVEKGQFVNNSLGGSSAFVESNDILANLNPNDIETVNVLKDAAATSLYGARGGNGVIVITTRKGKAGTSKINLSAQYGRSMPSLGNFGMMDAKRTYDYERAVLKLNGVPQQDIDDSYPVSLLDSTFDWVDATFINANVQNYNMSISGGTEKLKHYISLGYYDQGGTTLSSGFKRFSTNINIENQVSKLFKMGFSVNASYSQTLGADGTSYYSSPLGAGMGNSPLWVYPYKSDGSLYTGRETEFSKGSGNNTGDNTLYSQMLNYNKAKQFRALSKVYAELSLLKWLNVRQSVVMDVIYAREKNFFDPTTSNGINGTDDINGTVYEGLNNPLTFTSQTSVFGTVALKDPRHEVSYTGLLEYQKFSNSNFGALGYGIADGHLDQLGLAGTPAGNIGGINEYAFLSYLAQANYSYDTRYSLSTSIRRDGSSRFGVNNRFATFYSVGGAWHITNEAFMKDQSIFSDLRLRASLGTSGVADFGNYLAQQLYQYGQTYNGNPGSFPGTPGNPNLTWEKNEQTDVGLEMAFFNNRIRATVEWYKRVGTDLLQNVPVSRTSGFTSIQGNIGKVQNTGYELTLSTINVTGNGFQWTTDLNMSYNKNKVVKLYNGQPISNGTLGRTQEGQPLNSWFLAVWAGVDPANGDPLWYLADGKTTTNSYAIATRTENKQFVGSSLPKYTFGLNNSFSYRSFNLSFFLYAISGCKIYNQNMVFLGDNDGRSFGGAYYKDVDQDYWTTPGQQASKPKPVVGGNKSSASASSRYIESNDYIRLRNLSLSYNLPKSVISKASFTNARFFVSGTNLFTITNYRGIDPETAIGGNDVFKYPVNKTITVGIDITL